MKLTALLTVGFTILAAPVLACSGSYTAEMPTQSTVAELPPLLPTTDSTGS